jgi:glycerol uptake facilitator-like aquaporin
VFVGPASVAATASDSSFGRLVFVSAVFGGVVAAAIIAFGKISGAPINPAVLLGAFVRGDQGRREGAYYLAAEVAAAIAAGLSLRVVFTGGPSSAYLGSTSLAPGVDPMTGVAIEAVGTFALAMAAFSCSRLTASVVGQAAIVGTVLFLLIVLLGPFTSCSLNPARSLGPALAAGYLDNLWVYLVGPLAGGGLAGALARRINTRPPPAAPSS